VAFSPDGKILASGSADDTIKLWVVANGRESATLRGHKDSITSVAFSPDGKILASGSDDKTIRIWDVETGQTICMLRRHEDAITSVAFFPDGRTLASGSDDDSIILWGVVKPTLNLAAYFLGGWYTANETTGENHPSFGLQENLYRQRTYGFLNMSRGTHLSILQSARSPEEANRFLFEHYIRQKAWSGAFALLEQPMDRPIATRLRYTTGINFNISRGEYVGAVEYATRLANHLRELVSREEAAKSQLADALSELAWYQEMCGQFPEALKSAEEAVVLNREDVPSLLQASYAHALLFTGQYAKAATIYQKHKDKKYTFWRNWNDEVLNQLTLLRERGYSHADMTKIEALLRSKQK
jgi:hypothetical protein